MRLSRLTVLLVFAVLVANTRDATLEAQCPPPAGTYTMVIDPPVLTPVCAGDTVSFDIVGATGVSADVKPRHIDDLRRRSR